MRIAIDFDDTIVDTTKKVRENLNRYNLELVSFKGLDIYDYGSGMII